MTYNLKHPPNNETQYCSVSLNSPTNSIANFNFSGKWESSESVHSTNISIPFMKLFRFNYSYFNFLTSFIIFVWCDLWKKKSFFFVAVGVESNSIVITWKSKLERSYSNGWTTFYKQATMGQFLFLFYYYVVSQLEVVIFYTLYVPSLYLYIVFFWNGFHSIYVSMQFMFFFKYCNLWVNSSFFSFF